LRKNRIEKIIVERVENCRKCYDSVAVIIDEDHQGADLVELIKKTSKYSNSNKPRGSDSAESAEKNCTRKVKSASKDIVDKISIIDAAKADAQEEHSNDADTDEEDADEPIGFQDAEHFYALFQAFTTNEEEMFSLCEQLRDETARTHSASSLRAAIEALDLFNVVVENLNTLTGYVELNIAGFRKLLKQRLKQFGSLNYVPETTKRSILYHVLVKPSHNKMIDCCTAIGEALQLHLGRTKSYLIDCLSKNMHLLTEPSGGMLKQRGTSSQPEGNTKHDWSSTPEEAQKDENTKSGEPVVRRESGALCTEGALCGQSGTSTSAGGLRKKSEQGGPNPEETEFPADLCLPILNFSLAVVNSFGPESKMVQGLQDQLENQGFFQTGLDL